MYVQAKAHPLQKAKKGNRRSLRCATPDFLSDSVTLLKFLRLFYREPHTWSWSAREVGIQLRSGRDDNLLQKYVFWPEIR
jgi:hypothetical protein